MNIKIGDYLFKTDAITYMEYDKHGRRKYIKPFTIFQITEDYNDDFYEAIISGEYAECETIKIPKEELMYNCVKLKVEEM